MFNINAMSDQSFQISNCIGPKIHSVLQLKYRKTKISERLRMKERMRERERERKGERGRERERERAGERESGREREREGERER